MAKRKLIFIKDFEGGFRESIDPERLREILSAVHPVECSSYYALANEAPTLRDCYIVYASVQYPELKSYVGDILYFLGKDNILIPPYEIFRAHNDKGFQERLKASLGILSLPTRYCVTERDLLHAAAELSYPLVCKSAYGWFSANVHLVRDDEELIRIAEIDALGACKNKLILQQFVPGLANDWRVVVMGERYFVMHRKVREGDFRASGSRLLSYPDPPEGLLDYARSLFLKFDIPCAAFDVGHDGRTYWLFEFQGIHFGPSAVMNAERCFVFEGGKWCEHGISTTITEEYGRSVLGFIERRFGGVRPDFAARFRLSHLGHVWVSDGDMHLFG